MAGYFSNHSQSRFLANLNTANTAGSQSPTTQTQNPPTTPGRLRAPSSRHFSTSLSGSSGDEKSQNKQKGPGTGTSNGSSVVHPLRNTYVRVRRPVWEDPLNITGGKWIIRLRKGVADRLWEDLVLAIIGDQFADCEQDSGGNESGTREHSEWPEICGCTISVRQNEDIISLWNKVDADPKVKEKINQTIRRVLNLPATTTMEYKSNNDSMQDKSSFRVPAATERTPLS
ncbi:hypothetical protein PHLCEN_2v6046 [Hermanssonia centrifuga]|uniref:Eukaryotic translation initiation factor 4E n=1 Tax=Hermanssonia centrifuga TaxID=98765 RepID=A0A2R6P0S1_9APHY|nr:hypothetical protein PHLCEN_2v6046 [Hermanssonia centrifuga]